MPYKFSEQTFVNPYHFIPLENYDPDRKSFEKYISREYEGYDEQELNTGWIDCELSTITPLFIPNSSNDDYFCIRAMNKPGQEVKIKSYDFFSYNDLQNATSIGFHEPVIPGSSIRGVIRSAFEALTNSCMSTVADNHYLYKRFTKPYQNAGLIRKEKDQWFIQPCRIEKNNQQGAIVFNGEKGITDRKSQKYFVPQGDRFLIEDDDLSRFKKVIEFYRDDKINQKLGSGHTGYKHINLNNLHNCPVFYERKNGRLYISPAQIGKEVFHNSLAQLVGAFAPCNSLDELCPACLIFGIAGQNDSLCSRLRFSDARLTQLPQDLRSLFYEPCILPELASPKPSATEFYLVKNGNYHIWNYDYAGIWKKTKDGHNWYFEYDEDYCPKIMGRKFYWHKSINTPPSISKASERNVCVRALKKDLNLKFRIHFDGLFDFELAQLLWTLTIGDSNEHGHKIGMGKPLGMGSVKIKVNNVFLRRIELSENSIAYDITDEYQNFSEYLKEFDNPEELFGASDVTISAFKRINSLNNGMQDIRYPVNENEGVNPDAAFHWFKANKGDSIARPQIRQNLRRINEEDQRLKKYVFIPDSKSKKPSRR